MLQSNNALKQIHFNGTHFFNARLTQRVFFCLTHGPTVVGEMEMHSVANLATLQTPLETFFPSKKRPNLVSVNRWYCRASARSCSPSALTHTPSLGRESWLCSLNGSRFSHYFIFIPLSDNRNNNIYQWKQFYWEFSFIKIQYVGTERETNVIINNKCTFCIFRRRAALCAKCKQVCVSKCSVQEREVIWTWYVFFHVSNRHEQVLWKTSMTFETCLLFMLYVDYGFNNNKHTFA